MSRMNKSSGQGGREGGGAALVSSGLRIEKAAGT